MPEEGRKIHPGIVIAGGLGLGLVAAGAVYVLTRAARPPELPSPPPGLANLYGVVTDAETEEGLSELLVTLDDIYTYTDKDGYYAFTDLEPRDYSVMFSKEGYKTVVLEKTVKEGNNELNAALWQYALAELLLDGLRVTWVGAYKDKIVVGDTVHIWARAQNIGTEPGSWTITWRVGEKTETELLELEGKQIKQIAYTYFVPESPGIYEVEVDGLTGSFEVVEEEVEPVAVITSMDWGDITKHQGESFDIKITIESNFAGTVWTVGTIGQGEPSASFGAVYNYYGDFLGFLPNGFNIVKTETETSPFSVGGVELKKGTNTFSMEMFLTRTFPIGIYRAYAAVMPPAANWYSWPSPYDWKIGEAFEVLEELPQIWALLPLVCQHLTDYFGGLWTAFEVGEFDRSKNYVSRGQGRLPTLPLTPGNHIIDRDYYMQFHKPSVKIYDPEITGHPNIPYYTTHGLALGVFIGASPPKTRYGTPAETYSAEITGWLTYPDGHTSKAVHRPPK